MIVLVCGGREYTDERSVYAALDRIHDVEHITIVVHGGARGADSLAARWARDRDVPAKAFPAEWGTHGNRAGPIRNHQMIVEGTPDLVVAFPGGSGTRDMIARARKHSIRVIEIKD